MANEPTAQQLLDNIEARYRFRFAGHPRVSRDPEVMEELIASLDEVAGADGGAELSDRIREARELYQREREAIIEARAVPGAVAAYRLRLHAELEVGRYRRNFAGQARGTRDVHLLEEIRDKLVRVRDEMASTQEAGPHLGLGPAIDDASSTVELATREAERIREARYEGSHADQGTRFAQLANAQFELYQAGFAGQSRLSRHPPRLERIVAALEEIGAGMARLQRAGFDSENNDRNLKIVTERLAAYRKEVGAMAESRAEVSVEDRVNALGGSANQIFEAYREAFAGKNRASVDPLRLDALFEQLYAVAQEMDEIERDEDNDTNERNLALVLDQLTMYQREWAAIQEARVAARSDA